MVITSFVPVLQVSNREHTHEEKTVPLLMGQKRQSLAQNQENVLRELYFQLIYKALPLIVGEGTRSMQL